MMKWGLSLLLLFSLAFAQEAPVSVHLKEAMAMAIQKNVSVLLAAEKEREAQGQKIEAQAPLMPNLSVKASQANSTQNLAAFGFPSNLFPIPPLIGPYNTFDARIQLVQNVFNLSESRAYRSKALEEKVAGLREQLAEEQIAQFTAVSYVNCLRAERNVEANQANVELARSLLKLAEDQHTAGLATGVDVARAATRLSDEETKLSDAKTSAIQTRIEFKRAVGLPLDLHVNFADRMQAGAEIFPSAQTAIPQALTDRYESQIADQEIGANKAERESAEGEGIPSFAFTGNYGESGNTPGQLSLPVRVFMLEMDLPIFNGGLTRGRILEAKSKEEQARLTYHDTKLQIEEDVRLALDTLSTRRTALASAEESLRLARQELKLSEDRFKDGLTDNLEVVNAQTSLENSQNAEIGAMADYTIARINLAGALGKARAFQW